VDFLAIGTNDLTQALIEIHRDSPNFCLFQPALFRTIRKILEKAKIFKRQVSVCGEIVSNPVFTELLLGLGATDFSCSFHEIPQIKRKIMETRMDRAVAIAEKVLAAETPAEVKALLKMDP
jgi:phosphotransferase system enzyme I (PtsI)